MRDNTASGDPAMALRSSIRFTRTDVSVRVLGGLVKPPHNSGRVPAHKRARKNRARKQLAANAQLFDDRLVALFVGALQVIEQLAALRDHLEKAAPRMVVLHVSLEVIGQRVDP